ALCYALSAVHDAAWGPEALVERAEAARELVELAGEVGDKELALQGYAWRVQDLLEQGDVEAMDDDVASFTAIADELRQPLFLGYSTMFRAMRALLDGHFEEGEKL